MKYAIARNARQVWQSENGLLYLQQEQEEIPIDALDLETARHYNTPEYRRWPRTST